MRSSQAWPISALSRLAPDRKAKVCAYSTKSACTRGSPATTSRAAAQSSCTRCTASSRLVAATASSAFVRAASSSSARPPAGSGPTALIAERTSGCTPGSDARSCASSGRPLHSSRTTWVLTSSVPSARAVRIVPTLLSTRKSANSAPNTKLSCQRDQPGRDRDDHRHHGRTSGALGR